MIYVQIRKGGVWHPAPRFRPKCGVVVKPGASFYDWVQIWASKRKHPLQPLCKRCERIAEKESKR